MITILIFIVVLAILVLVHEIGHFVAARKSGVAIEEFGIGFPPRLFKWKRKDTLFSINLIPLGGFVKLKGEQGDHLEDADSFAHAKKWKKAIILASGIGMNIVLAIVIFTIIFSIGVPTVLKDQNPRFSRVSGERIQVVDVAKDSPAKEAGIAVGESLISLNGIKPKSPEDVKNIVVASEGNPITVIVSADKGKNSRTVSLTPKKLAGGDSVAIGIYSSRVGDVAFSPPYAFIVAIQETVKFIWLIIASLATIVWNLVVGAGVPADVVGPVGIAVVTEKIANLGIIYLLQFVALISLNLAVVNILPIPALDGGRLLFLTIEAIRKKPINQRVEAMVHNIGFAVLLGLIILITIRDITHLDSIKQLF